jgi:hypothetical protein
MKLIAHLSWLFVLTSCAAMRLAWLDPLPMDQPVVGQDGSYELVPPSDRWVRLSDNERGEQIDLSLARSSNDSWLNVSVLVDRFPTAGLALEYARTQADGLLTTISRDEREVAVPSPDGEVAARMGVYCGTFDRELGSRDSCFVMLAAVWQQTSYMLVGQVRIGDDPGRQAELERLVLSLRLRAAAEPVAGEG